MRISVWLLCLMTALCSAVTAAPAYGQTGTASEIDRELVVRFTRAYGMAKQAFEEHAQEATSETARDAMLRRPEDLDPGLRQEISRILDLNGLQADAWQMMFARMDADEDLRRRVQSLSAPFE